MTDRIIFPHIQQYKLLLNPTVLCGTIEYLSSNMSLCTDYSYLTPTISDSVHPNPREFSWLKIALENTLPVNASETFKFQILTEHLKIEEALLIADSYCHFQYSFNRTMAALDQQYGQPHQLALQQIA